MSLVEDIKDLINADRICESTRAYYKMANSIIRDNLREDMEYSVYYSLSDEAKEKIKDYILNGNYNNLVKALVIKLYEYTEIDNLLCCYKNLQNVKVVKDENFRRKLFSLRSRYVTGQYDPITNTIFYYTNSTLSHEFLHMASTPQVVSDDYYTTGFKMFGGNIEFAKGFNEGYTDLLNRRIYFDGDYNSDTCYKINIYLLRIFELLYDDYKTMERDYFISNYQSPIGNFMKYGSFDEFFKLINYLDWFASTKIIAGEDKEAFDLMKKIIRRCSLDKLARAEEITEEYFESEKKPYQKILKL